MEFKRVFFQGLLGLQKCVIKRKYLKKLSRTIRSMKRKVFFLNYLLKDYQTMEIAILGIFFKVFQSYDRASSLNFLRTMRATKHRFFKNNFVEVIPSYVSGFLINDNG